MKNLLCSIRAQIILHSSFNIYSSFKINSSFNLYSFFPKYFKNCVRSKVLMP